jgi:serine kinase of HPr protein (carbohydrate metabolism regulator)
VSSCQRGIDRLGWLDGGVFSCHGARVGLRASTPAAFADMVSWLPRAMARARGAEVPVLYSLLEGGAVANSKVKRSHILYRNFTRIARSLEMDDIRRSLQRDLGIQIGEGARGKVFVHAGVVAIDGVAIVIPGRSFSGKTTLTRALVEQGGVYYSDEYAILDSRGRVSPWTEPLSIRKGTQRRAGERRTAESLGFVSGRGSMPVRLVVMTDYAKGRRFQPRSESRAAGALAMLQHALPARLRPRAALRALSSAVEGATILRGPRGEARAAAKTILRYLSAARRA